MKHALAVLSATDCVPAVPGRAAVPGDRAEWLHLPGPDPGRAGGAARLPTAPTAGLPGVQGGCPAKRIHRQVG